MHSKIPQVGVSGAAAHASDSSQLLRSPILLQSTKPYYMLLLKGPQSPGITFGEAEGVQKEMGQETRTPWLKPHPRTYDLSPYVQTLDIYFLSLFPMRTAQTAPFLKVHQMMRQIPHLQQPCSLTDLPGGEEEVGQTSNLL